jgi:hypothetical protein
LHAAFESETSSKELRYSGKNIKNQQVDFCATVLAVHVLSRAGKNRERLLRQSACGEGGNSDLVLNRGRI